MKISDAPRAVSKKLDVLAEFEKSKAKKAANFVVIGNIFSSFQGNERYLIFHRSC